MRIFCTFVSVFAVACLASTLLLAQADDTASTKQNWPGKISHWNGFVRYDFSVDGRPAFVVEPKIAAAGKPWVWRARFPNYHPESDAILLKRGFHVAHIDTSGMLGSPGAMKHWDAFYQFVTKRGLNKKVALEAVSRGGLFAYGFASNWPERITCIYGDTPVCDLKSWPGGKGTGRGHEATWKTALQEYNLTETSILEFKGNPIDRLGPIAKSDIPILHIVSLNDQIVPAAENTFVLAQRYRKLGGTIDIIEVKVGTVKSGGHHFPHPDPVRVADFIERHSACLPAPQDYFTLRDSLDNCRLRFTRDQVGRVAFLGGSITQMEGWRNQVQAYLCERFPETKFDFIDAGIGSTGSTPAAFRLEHDVLARGRVDLLFEEAAVNDPSNGRSAIEMTRGMEGILRHARRSNPEMDIVVMHFVMPKHMKDFRSGNVPEVIQQHEQVAQHYNVSTINLAREVTERIDAGQFDWQHDFVNLHPSEYGQQIYSASIRRLLSHAWATPLSEESKIVAHAMPEMIDSFSYDSGTFVPLEKAVALNGFQIINPCDPTAEGVGGSTREGFNQVPMLVGTQPGASFSLKFHGRGVGLFVAAGPDAGTIRCSIDGGEPKTVDLMTPWSRRLHIPWVIVLENELTPGDHEITVVISENNNEKSKGTACRIVRLLVNGRVN